MHNPKSSVITVKLVIAISGQVGAGKTTQAKKLAETFNLKYVSNGMLFRELARERGVSLQELHKIAERDPEIDRIVDSRAREVAMKGNVVVEGHLACWLLRDIADICIFFKAPLEERARRVMIRDNVSYDEALRDLQLRERSNWSRAMKYYGVNIHNWTVADLIIDTSKLSIEGINTVLVTFVQLYIREKLKEIRKCRK